ncbi:MAG TPA: barstar family protein [Dissulfurispiraceae bacterium]|nr:barstar family protein [Dissulfurispiraceae bacterium]
MPLRKYVLDGNSIRSARDFYDAIVKAMPLPDHFGRNLDALADALTTDVDGPFEIVWEHSDTSKKAMKHDYAAISAVLKHVAAERNDARVTFRQ